eukprot:CAMPEP_0116870196 /NCGR_PEP_ID=MMETSP0463-20121206/62_1 /TAXON_ID=181622 /ORGANISM="Strombidinopsis sp, Strain SopsisLIS2011" /LENGTH=129 /DNA_ID=CAMNT_0004506407 /DNA_START=916 /DNA_END=1305 /DNA_ORIENTATION=-
MQDFRKSLSFKAIEQAALMGDDLAMRDAPEESKFDLDSEDGQTNCKNYLSCLERLFQVLNVKVQPRMYRSKFTKSYQVLYGSSFHGVSYLTEILDSAQESFPHLWVNGEKYVFSENVITSGNDLFEGFM